MNASSRDSNYGVRRTAVLAAASVVLVVGAAISLAYAQVQRYHAFTLHSVESVQSRLTGPHRTGIVFGSGVDSAGNPRPILASRLDAAFELYQNNAVNQIIVSGYDPPGRFSEPRAMAGYLTGKGVSPDSIIADDAGVNTHATCLRAKSVFGIDQAVLVTQAGHLDRAMYLCRAAGIEAYGYPARAARSKQARFLQSVREAVSNVKAVIDANTAR